MRAPVGANKPKQKRETVQFNFSENMTIKVIFFSITLNFQLACKDAQVKRCRETMKNMLKVLELDLEKDQQILEALKLKRKMKEKISEALELEALEDRSDHQHDHPPLVSVAAPPHPPYPHPLHPPLLHFSCHYYF